MERMGDILARTMGKRTRPAGAPDGGTPASNGGQRRPGASRARPTTRPLPAGRASDRGRSLPASASTGNRRLTPRPLPRVGGAAAVRPTPLPPPPSAPAIQGDALETLAPASRAPQAGSPRPRPADAADERILELPPRRAASVDRPGSQPATASQPRAGDAPAGSSSARGATTAGAGAPRPLARPRPAQLREDASAYVAAGAQSGAASLSAGAGPAVCPICGGAGYVRLDVPLGDPAFGKPVPCECKERQIEERRRSDLRRMSSLDPFLDKTFATFDGAVQGTHEAFEAARTFAADPEGWIVLSGTHGVGKTHLAAAIANMQLAQGTLVFFSIVPDLLDHLRAAFAPSSEVPYDEMFDKVREAGLLVLDDLGAENSTAWATEKLFQLINYRYNFRMPTVITTNTRLLAHMDERIRSRLSDIGLVRHVAIKAQDYRERHAERRPRASGAPRAGGGPGTRG